jgi:hypothetical protein
MPALKPFRDYDEHEVINLFGYSGTYPTLKGTFVKVAVGWTNESDIRFMGSIGASYPHAVNERFGVPAWVTACSSGDAPLGVMLYDAREVDENGELLKFKPSKADAKRCIISGQAVPVLKRGMILYSGVYGSPVAGTTLYTWNNGELSTSGASTHAVGKALGPKDSKGWVLINVDL